MLPLLRIDYSRKFALMSSSIFAMSYPQREERMLAFWEVARNIIPINRNLIIHRIGSAHHNLKVHK